MINKVNLAGIPQELTIYRQWCVWKYEQKDGRAKPTKVPYNPITGAQLSVTSRNMWAGYRDAVTALDRYDGLGFVLTKEDPYTVMDLDAPSTDEDKVKYQNYYARLNSFTEISPSGTGCHVWVKGSIPRGRNSRPFELYSDSRFITVTGNVHNNVLIAHRQDVVDEIWTELGEGKAFFSTHTGDAAPSGTDQEVIDRASKARNGSKFCHLWHGQYQEFYASQSEADFALIDIIAFYTQNMEQIVRLFRFSALGQREKAQRERYVEDMALKAFDKLPPKADLDELSNSIDAVLEQYKKDKEAAELKFTQVTEAHLPSETYDDPDDDSVPITQEMLAMIKKSIIPDLNRKENNEIVPSGHSQELVQPDWLKANVTDILEAPLYFPHGLVGEAAEFIFKSAPRPVKEIAIAGALGLMAGITGSSYNVSGSGLNLYIILLAGTGTGKEAITSGINKLMSRVEAAVPSAGKFMGSGHIASPQALLKSLGTQSRCQVSIMGEAGLWLKELSDPNASAHVVGLRRLLLELYGRSGRSATLSPSIYADTTKNTEAIRQPAYSILGESTQSKFLENVNSGLISEGFIPRWLMIEYRGKRVPYNESHASIAPKPELLQALAHLCQMAHSAMESYSATDVGFDSEELRQEVKQFNEFCDAQINGATDEGVKDLWTRTYLKAMRVAAIVAVGINPNRPLIGSHAWEFAKLLVLKDTMQFCKQLNSGFAAIGNENEAYEQIKAIRDSIKQVLTEMDADKRNNYGITDLMFKRNIIPYSYLSRRCYRRKEFSKSKRGSVQALKHAIADLELSGTLLALSDTQATTEFETSGKLYAIANIADILYDK